MEECGIGRALAGPFTIRYRFPSPEALKDLGLGGSVSASVAGERWLSELEDLLPFAVSFAWEGLAASESHEAHITATYDQAKAMCHGDSDPLLRYIRQSIYR